MDRIPQFTYTSVFGRRYQPKNLDSYHKYSNVIIDENILCLITSHRDENQIGNQVTIYAGTTISRLKILAVHDFNKALGEIVTMFEIGGKIRGKIPEEDFYFRIVSYDPLTKSAEF